MGDGNAGGIAGLEQFVTRWWGQLEADFQRFYRIDLGDLWRGRLTPRRLKVLVDGLPPDAVTIRALVAKRQDVPAGAGDMRKFFANAVYTGKE